MTVSYFKINKIFAITKMIIPMLPFKEKDRGN